MTLRDDLGARDRAPWPDDLDDLERALLTSLAGLPDSGRRSRTPPLAPGRR